CRRRFAAGSNRSATTPPPPRSSADFCFNCSSRRRSPRLAGCWARRSSARARRRTAHKIAGAMADKKPPAEIADLLQEDRSFPPRAAFREKANINDPGIYERAEKDPEAFWASFASELEWFTKWSKVLEWKPPHAK